MTDPLTCVAFFSNKKKMSNPNTIQLDLIPELFYVRVLFCWFFSFLFFFLGLKAVDNYIDLKKVIKQLLHYTRQRVSLKVFSCK